MISVCMPTYNRSEYLAEAIDSVIGQSYGDWELVVVDDGSTDSTPVLMDYYVSLDPRVRYERLPENVGIAAARNRAVELSAGEFVAVMDSDDLMGPDRLKMQLKELQKGADACYGSYLRADASAVVIDGVRAPAPSEISTESLLKDQGIPHVTLTARRQCFLDNPYDPAHRVNDDYALAVAFVRAGYRLRRIDAPLMIVRYHPTNTTKVAAKEIERVSEQVREGLRGA